MRISDRASLRTLRDPGLQQAVRLARQLDRRYAGHVPHVTEAIRVVLRGDRLDQLPVISVAVGGVWTVAWLSSLDLDGTYAALGVILEDPIAEGRTVSVAFAGNLREVRELQCLVRWSQARDAMTSANLVIQQLDPSIRATLLELAEHALANHEVRECQRRLQPIAPVDATSGDDLRARLLGEVLAAPDDDEPRLVYADWLTERGDPRGEFITIQCDLARRGPDATGEDVERLRAREVQLLARHKKTWIGRFSGTRTEMSFGSKTYTKGSPTKWEFERGFVDAVTMWTTDFARNAPALMACEPVRVLHLTNGYLTELLEQCPEMRLLRELDLATWKFRGDELRALARTVRLSSMRVLDLSKCRIGVKAMVDFATHAVEKPGLRALSLWWNAMGDKGAIALAASPVLRSIRQLDLCNNNIAAKGGLALAASPHLDDIELLDLSANDVGDAAAALRARFGARVRLLATSDAG